MLNEIDFQRVLVFFGVFIFSLTFHEYAHAQVADWLGDDTPRMLGRVTVNPFSHIELFGSVILPLIALSAGSGIFLGWAKPVPVSTYRLSKPRRALMLIAVAGPVTNLLIALLAAAVLRIPELRGNLALGLFVHLNILLALFNMFPIHPLDGSKVLGGLLPRSLANGYAKLETAGPLILIGFLITGIFSMLIVPPLLILDVLLIPRGLLEQVWG